VAAARAPCARRLSRRATGIETAKDIDVPLKVACQMDPIERIDIQGDSTFAILLEAQRRGHDLFYYTPSNLALHEAGLLARGTSLKVADKVGDHYALSRPRTEDLSGFDVVLLRQDPPFDMAYVTTTHLLERVQPRTLVVNDPTQVRNAPEKIFVLDFPDLMPPTLLTRSPEDVKAFRARHKDIILKPLYGNGGASVFRVRPDDDNLNSLIELFLTVFREPFMVQEYRPEVRKGDKRIVLIDGELAGAVNRVPPQGETRSNLHVGGRAEVAEITARDREICARLGPELRRRGLLFTGIDVIGPYLTEINVTSPTGIRHIQQLGGPDIAALMWDVIERKVASRG
jgi:glutathione synthase